MSETVSTFWTIYLFLFIYGVIKAFWGGAWSQLWRHIYGDKFYRHPLPWLFGVPLNLMSLFVATSVLYWLIG